MYNVVIRKGAIKGIEKMPHIAQLAMGNLIEDLKKIRPDSKRVAKL